VDITHNSIVHMNSRLTRHESVRLGTRGGVRGRESHKSYRSGSDDGAREELIGHGHEHQSISRLAKERMAISRSTIVVAKT